MTEKTEAKRLAIVGAGVSGLAAAWFLREAPLDVVLFEKSRGVSGRAATRGRQGARFDHGANYFRLDDPEIEKLVREVLPTDRLVEVAGDVWTFGADGTLAPGDPVKQHGEKWTYRDGISTLGKLLAAAAPGYLYRQKRIQRLEQDGRQWTLVTTEGEIFSGFDAVLLTPPAPQSADVLRKSRMPDELRAHLVAALEQAEYRTQLSFALGYDHVLARPAEACYACINTDRKHPVAWLSFEEAKPGHVPEGESLLIVQMAPSWSVPRYEEAPEVLLPGVLAAVASVLDVDPGAPAWNRSCWLPDCRRCAPD